MQIDIDLTNIKEMYLPHFWELHLDKSAVQILRGSRGSAKSYYWAEECVFDILNDLDRFKHKFLVMRKWSEHCNTSVVPQLKEILDHWNIPSDLYTFNKTTKTFTFINGSEIICMGCNEPERLKSIPNVTKLVFEEATDFTDTDYTTISAILRGSYPKFVNIQTILAFNPVSKNNWIYKRFFENGELPGVKYHHSTFMDNPYNGPGYKEKLLQLVGNNKYLHDVMILGHWGVESGLIYHPDQWKRVDSKDIILESEPIYGLDLGYNHASALIQINKINDTTFYLKQLLYAREMLTPELIEHLHALIPDKNCFIYGDGARPEIIEEIFQQDFNIHAADKSPGSVKTGLEFCKRFNYLIDDQSVDLIREIQSYSWKVDKNGDCMDEPIKENDDCCDGFRMAVYSHYFGGMGDWEMKVI